MNNIIKQIEIDMYAPTFYEVIKAQQNDENSRFVEFILYNQGEPYVIPNNVLIKLEGQRANKSPVIKPCSVTDNIVTVELDKDLLYYHGIAHLKLVIYKEDENSVLSTIPFTVSIQKNPLDSNKFEKDNYSLVHQLILQTETNTKKIDNEIKRAKEAEKVITDNLNAEITRAKNAESANATAINNEVVRAKEAESNLDSKKANIDSPTFTGTPKAPTASDGTNTTQIATTAFTQNVVSNHNTSNTSHTDIRDLITELTNRLNALADSDDTTLDQLSEIVAYIKSNRTLIENVTTNKVNVSDIIDNLTSTATNKPLSANQGKVLKGLIDTLTSNLNTHIGDKSNPHGVTKEQVGLGNVENKSSATIRSELTKENVTTALGYTPPTTDTNTWRPLGTGASDACAGNDNRLSNAREPYFANNKWYSVGDDVAIGDHNVAGTLCIKGTNGNPGIKLYDKNGNAYADVYHSKNLPAYPTSLPASDVYAWAKASTKPSYSWSEITGKPSTFTPTSHTHNYLPLSGGTLTGAVTCNSTITFGQSDNYGLRVTTNNYCRIGASDKRFYESYINKMYGASVTLTDNGSSSATTYNGQIYCADLTANRTYVLPNLGGTIALTSGNASLSATELTGTRICAGYDPNVNNSVSCSNWFRSSGNTGWFNASYGGGIYMIDSTWVRTYNSKSFYCEQTIRADGGLQTINAEINGGLAGLTIATYSNYFRIRNDGNAIYFMNGNSSNWTNYIIYWQDGRTQFCNTITCAGGYFNSTLCANATTTATANCYIDTAGTFLKTTGTTSSKRFKENITTEMNEELNPDKLYDVNVVQFMYKKDYFTNKEDIRYRKPMIGFIAEDIYDKYQIAADYHYDENGEVIVDGWNQQYMIPAMLKLIQELHTELEILKKR